MRKSRVFIAALVAFLGLGTLVPRAQTDAGVPQKLPVVALHIGKATLQTQIADTPDEREKGLMYYTHLGDNEGMLFVMGSVAPATFWMKNTLIPLSVAFIDKDGVILEIHDMAPSDPSLPDSALPVTRSQSPNVAYALETNLHWFSLNGIKPGMKFDPSPTTLTKTATP